MAEKIKSIIKDIENLKLDKKPEVNLLLLGTSGVGKSTFINALANYLTYRKLKDAEREKLMVLIPASVNISDGKSRDHSFFVSNSIDNNEHLEVGASATQDVKTYVFPIGNGNTKLRIIDSPGIGDTRGVSQDAINCEKILSYLTNIDKLHAICLLFPTTVSRNNPFVSYCFKEILSRLDKSASKNLVFILVNARAANFSPGDTKATLSRMVSDIEKQQSDLTIPFDNENIFCFENDCFKYLAAKKQNIEFNDEQRSAFAESWKHSSRECWRLVQYMLKIQPHDIRNTVSVNEARRIIYNLSKPLADISELIQDNINILERHKYNLQIQNESIQEIKKKLYIPVINLRVTSLTQPVTVCCSDKCAEVFRVGTLSKWHYKQRCHDPCHLTDVNKEHIGDPALINCDAMCNRKCIKCLCDFSTHMHVYYFTTAVEDNIEDAVMMNSLKTKEEALQQLKIVMAEIESRKKEYEKERDDIVKYTAQFAHFLQKNAMAPINDSYEQYINYLIEREQTLGQAMNPNNIKNLRHMLLQYRESKRTFDTALEMQKKLGSEIDIGLGVTPEKIFDTENKLYCLKHTGKKIQDLVNSQRKPQAKEFDKTSEYVHASPANMFTDIGKKRLEKENFNSSSKKGEGINELKNTQPCKKDFNNDRKKQPQRRDNSAPRRDWRHQNSEYDTLQQLQYPNRYDRRNQRPQFDGRPQNQQTVGSYNHPVNNYNTSNTPPPPYEAISRNHPQNCNSYVQGSSWTNYTHQATGSHHAEANVFYSGRPTCGDPNCKDLRCVPVSYPSSMPLGYDNSSRSEFCGPPQCDAYYYDCNIQYRPTVPSSERTSCRGPSTYYNAPDYVQYQRPFGREPVSSNNFRRGGFKQSFSNQQKWHKQRGEQNQQRRYGKEHLGERKFGGIQKNAKNKKEVNPRKEKSESTSSDSSSSSTDSDSS